MALHISLAVGFDDFNVTVRPSGCLVIRHVNSGGAWGGVTPPQCLENTIGLGKSLTSLGICWLDEDTFLGKLAMLGQLTLTGKPKITLPIC